jgi:hypothetical protein
LPSLVRGWTLPLRAVCSRWLDCGVSALSPEKLAAPTVATSVATSTARDTFLALRFIDLLLTEMPAHGILGALEFRHDGEESGRSQYGRGPDLLARGTGGFRQRGGSNARAARRLVSGDRCRTVSRRRRRCVRTRPIRPVRGAPGPGRRLGLHAPAPGKDWWLGAEIQCGNPV